MDNIESLEREIRKHDKLYWEKGQPEISDSDYDKLVEELRILNPNNVLINKIHTPKVSTKKKIKHINEMLSLDKVYSTDDLIKWCEKVARNEDEEFLIQLKYDGCSAELANGILSTRGDGFFGEDITSKLPIIEVFDKKKISGTECKEYIRGEILIQKKIFQKIKNSFGGKTYKTERNMCAGILNRDDVDLSLGLILTLVDFNAMSMITSLKEIKSELNWHQLIKTSQAAEFPADGIVFKIKDEKYAKSLGVTSHHSKSEIALKFENPTGKTILLDVEWSAGKHKLTPIGKVRPVEISGVTVSNINLHNYKYILDNDIQIGDTIIVERAGDVIPDVQSSYPTEGGIRQFVDIRNCPECGFSVEYIEPEIICLNTICPGKHLAQLMDSIRRIGIERLGEPTLKKMIKILKVYDLIDIFKLEEKDFLNLEGFAKTSAKNLFDEIQTVKKQGVFEWQILSAINLNGIGKTLSKDLLKNRDLSELREMNVNDFLEINGIGLERANILVGGLIEKSIYVDRLLDILPRKGKSNMDMTGLVFALTGAMPLKRNEITKMVEEKGGEIKGISKDIDYVVAADPESKSGKVKKAIEYGIPIISFDQLMEKLS